jgi:hypothetical protein
MGYHAPIMDYDFEELHISDPGRVMKQEVEERLRQNLAQCRDLAFAYLAKVLVPGRQSEPNLVLFAWLRPASLRSVRQALNLISEAVARALPKAEFLDVVILNSAPDLLAKLATAGRLVNDSDPDELARALEAKDQEVGEQAPVSRPRWWPFE